ncbi:FAD-dependent oxidoreductase [Phytohabitans kaempferiae]|uniref:FAD-dependent oxidoreductase n=1 Tax=Phytohabitans kaempferiae TaxID=1620943 RepID=A0ABV6MBR9_9ACTN
MASPRTGSRELRCDVLVVGGGVGGVAAALAAVKLGASVILTDQFRWLGGQFTSQAVPPDESIWVEQFGVTASYADLRERIRAYYRRNYPLTTAARAQRHLNPGAGYVSKLCHEPRVAAAVIDELLAPGIGCGRLRMLQPAVPTVVFTAGDRIESVELLDLRSGDLVQVTADYVLDATETGELLALGGVEHVVGAESRDQTQEPHAALVADPTNLQALSVCFAIDHIDGDHTIDKPARYDYFAALEPDVWGGPLLSFVAPDPRTGRPLARTFDPNPGLDPLVVESDQRTNRGDVPLWLFRRIAARHNFEPGYYESDICLVNWPMHDYFLEPYINSDDPARVEHDARQLALSLLYWLQTAAPRLDGGTGYPGLRLRGDVTGGHPDGLAESIYHRESRRIVAEQTIREQDVSLAIRGDAGATSYPDSVGLGMYRIDLHPSTGGDPYIDIASCPFEIPLGALIPVRLDNLLPAAKNVGTTHITNGCYRLHPVEWNIGEVAGALAAHCVASRRLPRQVRADPALREGFQRLLGTLGVQLRWPSISGY